MSVDAGAGRPSPLATGDICAWCGASLAAGGDKWCSKRCRQTAWRFRKAASLAVLDDAPKRLAYADPPYPGNAWKWYGQEPTYAGEVDHRRLIGILATYDGWALSTSRKALKDVLSLCPGQVIVCPWVKPMNHPTAIGIQNCHEYVLVVPARKRRPAPLDAFCGSTARGGDSSLPGRKPLKFVAWLFELLGAAPGDALDDLFPGSGVVGRCWKEFSVSSCTRRLSPAAASDVVCRHGRRAA